MGAVWLMRCASCGYAADVHVGDTDLRCPVCVCGEVVGAHGVATEPPSPLRAFADDPKTKVIRPCPGKDTQLRHGHLREPEPIDRTLWREIMRRDALAAREAIEAARRPYEPDVAPPPLVPARAPRAPHEFAGGDGKKQATKLGRGAVALGWSAEPWYWKDGFGNEGCAVRLRRGPLRAVATWKRKAEHAGELTGWAADVAYAWRTDVDRFPMKLTHTQLEGLIT